jgi:uncharacterized RDD family membrane protein YckC
MTDKELQQKRLIAAVIDGGIAIAIFVVFYAVGWGVSFAASQATESFGYLHRIVGFLGAVLGLAYVLGRDVFGQGRSLGKKIQEIRVVVAATGQPVTFVDSAKRNAIFALGSSLSVLSSTFQLIPCLGDAVACILIPLMVLSGLIGLVALGVELYKIVSDPEGVRLGDQFAGTRVIR